MVFFHGYDTCPAKHCFYSDKVVEIFKLDTQVENCKRGVALAVPAIYWNPGNDVNKNAIQNAWSAANLNKFVDEALDQIKGQNSGLRPKLRNLILAGHSGAYAILTPLATKFKSDAAVTTTAPTKEGALAQLSQVLAIDTTYGTGNAISLVEWARQLESKKVKFFVVLNDTGVSDCKTKCDPTKETKKCWDCASKGKLPANLEVILGNGHCGLPKTTIQLLLEGKLGTGKP